MGRFWHVTVVHCGRSCEPETRHVFRRNGEPLYARTCFGFCLRHNLNGRTVELLQEIFRDVCLGRLHDYCQSLMMTR